MFGCVYGYRIEECIIVYSIYRDRKNSLSVFVGQLPAEMHKLSNVEQKKVCKDLVKNFMLHHPMFTQKYQYLDVSWSCAERKDLLVAVFKYAHDRYIEVKPTRLFYAKNVTPKERGVIVK